MDGWQPYQGHSLNTEIRATQRMARTRKAYKNLPAKSWGYVVAWPYISTPLQAADGVLVSVLCICLIEAIQQRVAKMQTPCELDTAMNVYQVQTVLQLSRTPAKINRKLVARPSYSWNHPGVCPRNTSVSAYYNSLHSQSTEQQERAGTRTFRASSRASVRHFNAHNEPPTAVHRHSSQA